MRTATIVTFAIVPALLLGLAEAAPKKRRPPKTKKKPPAKVEPKATEPAPTPDEPPPAATPATPTTPTPTFPPGTPVGAGSAAPAADSPKSTPTAADDAGNDASDTAAGTEGADVDTLRQDYLKLRDQLFASRARASTVASQLFSTRIQVKLTYASARFYNPGKATVRLDGANVYDDATGAIGGNDNIRFDGYVAPGRHVLTFRVEATGKDDDSFTSVTETQVVVKAVAGKDLVVTAKARDGGNIAYEWKKSERGTYGLGIDVHVKTQAPSKGGK